LASIDGGGMKKKDKPVVKNQRPRRWFNTPKVKIPKVPKLIKNANLVRTGLLASVRSSTGNNLLYDPINSAKNRENEKPIIGAGRGGKHYGKTSAMGQMADSAVKTVRQNKKERKPYKPIPQMHTLKSLEDMRRF
jgi:hypothetical protein